MRGKKNGSDDEVGDGAVSRRFCFQSSPMTISPTTQRLANDSLIVVHLERAFVLIGQCLPGWQ